MNYKKNDTLILKIEDMGKDGEGIGHADGYALFVKGALAGETVRVRIMKLKKQYGFARLLEVTEPSPQRTTPLCPSAAACGGCTLQHMDYAGQLAFKEKKVHDCLIRIGGVDMDKMECLPILGMHSDDVGVAAEPWHYRNKAQFPVRSDEQGNPVTGFFAGHSHRLIPADDCQIQHPLINKAVSLIINFMKTYSIPAYREAEHKGLVRHIYVRRGYHTKQMMVCLVINGTSLPHVSELTEMLKQIEGMTSICLNHNTSRTNVILGPETELLWGSPIIEDTIGGVKYQISPLSFYQVNPIQTEKLYQTVRQFADLQGGETVWDLYCGIGTISLFLASQTPLKKSGRVIGVEIVPEAIENAKANARLNAITNADFYCGAAEDVVGNLTKQGETKADVIVVDPPRKGCDTKLLHTIVQMAPEKIVYVSCDPATLARDVKMLGAEGYEVKKVRAVDMFPQGGHVETVVLLSHKKPDGHINVKVEFGEEEGRVSLKEVTKRAETRKPKEKVTYKKIQDYIEKTYGFKVHTAYIAEVKRELGLPMYDAPNAVEELKRPRAHPTPKMVEAIKETLKYFEIV